MNKKITYSIYYNNSKTIYNEKVDKNDTISIRKYAPSYTQYYDKPQRNIKRCKIVVDSWYQGKTLSMMAWQHKAIKEQPCLYYLDITNNKVVKLKEYLNKCKAINSKYVYKGIKSQAYKQLRQLVKQYQ